MPDAASLFSPLVEHAIELAAQWHDQTYRKSRWRDPAFDPPVSEVLRVPVIAHVTAVGMTVQRAGWDDVTIAAAFLHDVIEDANQFGQTMRYEELQALLGTAVANRVLEVTEQKYDADGRPRSWFARKEGYVKHLHDVSAEAVGISLADKLHNLWSMNESLVREIDIFQSDTNRRGLSAGPDRQRWFHQAVLNASRAHDNPRLEPQRRRLQEEIARFEQLAFAEDEMRRAG